MKTNCQQSNKSSGIVKIQKHRLNSLKFPPPKKKDSSKIKNNVQIRQTSQNNGWILQNLNNNIKIHQNLKTSSRFIKIQKQYSNSSTIKFRLSLAQQIQKHRKNTKKSKLKKNSSSRDPLGVNRPC